MTSTLTRCGTAALLTTAAVLLAASPATAHPHTVEKNGQVIANGQNHMRFDSNGDSCTGYPSAGPALVGPAWYGLETAHHGPDRGAPGRGDGCYRTAVAWNGTAYVPIDDTNPAIK